MNKTDSLAVIFHDMLEPLPIDEKAVSLKVQVLIFSYSLTMRFSTMPDKTRLLC